LQGGLKDCGFDTALQLAKQDKLLDLLYFAAHTSQERQARAALQEWREVLRGELADNRSGLLNSRRPSAASNVTDDFPDLATLHLYAKPLTTGSAIAPTTYPHLELCTPDTGRLTVVASRMFNWDLFAIVRRLSSSVWTGSCLRELLKVRK
jgi:hypothetical protein